MNDVKVRMPPDKGKRSICGAGYLFLSANTPWVYALAQCLAQNDPVRAVRLYDWNVYLRQRPTWPIGELAPQLQRSTRVLPPGYAGRFERFIRPAMRAMVHGWYDALGKDGVEPWVVVPYPYLAPWVRHLPGDRLIYYNLDDYRLYRPERAAKIQSQEDELICRSALTLCLSVYQVEALRKRHPDREDCIQHFPLGVTKAFLNPHPERSPDPRTVVYVGNLTDRIDWWFVLEVVKSCPELRFLFVGGIDDLDGVTSWQRVRREVLAFPNVQHVTRIPQHEVVQFYWRCAVNWIPYAVDHPFNLASCPTKIMDGIGSGHPIISTNIPESRLYPKWIHVANTPEEAIYRLKQVTEERTMHDVGAQVAFARLHAWQHRADQLRSYIAQVHAGIVT